MLSDRHAAPPLEGRARTGFRDDIQGMRALAVLTIMAFHAGMTPFTGGFVTLDVFFVISGFLITSLLLREIALSGTLSLRRFYARRARRILPAATVATVAIVAASWTWLSLVEAKEAATDARWATLFGANIRFATEETDYFSEGQPPSPFQHYWSLSVEEQFYIVLPLVLLACVVAAARRRLEPRQLIGRTLLAVTAVSFTWSLYASTASPETSYFSTFTRVWEFGIGGLVALVAPRAARPLTARARNLLAGLGLAAIVLACFIVTERTAFPGYAALLPVLGTAAIMLAGAQIGSRPSPLTQRALGVGPLRQIGDMSYSLYLWHWPVLVIASGHLGRDLSAVETGLAFVAVFALSWASHRFVETPFRRGMPLRLGQGLVLYPALLVVVVGTMGVSAGVQRELDNAGGPAITPADYRFTPEGNDLDPNKAVALVQASARAARDGARVPGDLRPRLDRLREDKADMEGCDYENRPWRRCRRGDPDGDRTLVVLGDSHGRHWIPAIEAAARKHGYAAYYLVKQRCTAVRVAPVRRRDDGAWRECMDFNDWTARQVAALEPDLVVISTTGASIVEIDGEVVDDREAVASALRAGVDDTIRTMSEHADQVTVLADVPRRRSEPGVCLSVRGARLDSCDNEQGRWASRVVGISRASAEANGARFVPTRQWFCAEGVCPPVVGSTVTMRDRGHVTAEYAAQLTDPLARALELR